MAEAKKHPVSFSTADPRPRLDFWLLVMVVIWAANYSVLKIAFKEIPPQPFNAMRMLIASGVYLYAIREGRRRAKAGLLSPALVDVVYTKHDLTTSDRLMLVWLGVVGHFGYQMCFVGGVNLTSVSNAALIIGATPVAVALVSAGLGRERLGWMHWVGAAVSASGIYFVVGHSASFGGATLRGDLLMLLSVACWATYTIGASRLMARHSPLYVTGMTMTVGAIPYTLAALPRFLDVHWAAVSAWTWTALPLSALLALNLSYLIWYMAVKQIGPSRTSIYSNVVPIVAMAIAWLWLGEPLTAVKIAGAAAVIAGVLLTRIAKRPAAVAAAECVES